MFYRCRVDLAFPTEALSRKAAEKAIANLALSIIINEGQENEERGSIVIQKCFHDENPNLPCDLLDSWETPSTP